MNERRAHPRVQDSSRVTVTILSAPEDHELENHSFECSSGDLSAGGMRLRLPSSVPVGGTVEVKLSLGTPPHTLWHVGRVVWSRAREGELPYEVGVRFSHSPQTTLLVWEEILREKLARAAAPSGGARRSSGAIG